MTCKTLTTSILLATSFLLLTACNSKSNSKTDVAIEQNTTTQTTATTGETEEINITVSLENNDTIEMNTTTVDTDGSTEINTTILVDENSTATNRTTPSDENTTETNNTSENENITETNTTVPNVNIRSLELTVEKTSLNREENTTVKAEIIYDDNTAKDVTDQVAWIATPKDTLNVTNNTLITLKDINTTLQAKLGTRVSNTIHLDLYWEVRGHRLPYQPDKTLNDSTLLGIDTNNNNVRDDVERWIYETYKDKHPIHIDIAMQAGRACTQVLKNPERAKEIHDEVNAPLYCQGYYKVYAKYFDEPLLVKERIIYIVDSRVFNTKERSDTYWQYDKLLSGGVYDMPKIGEGKNFCDFNTSNYSK